jgi:hypothetical protein
MRGKKYDTSCATVGPGKREVDGIIRAAKLYLHVYVYMSYPEHVVVVAEQPLHVIGQLVQHT